MLKDLKTILDADDAIDESDFRKAAQMLLAKQFLYRQKNTMRKHYELISRHNRYFRNLMDAQNYQLCINENQGYVGIIPVDFVSRMKLEETLILLVMRNVYEEKVKDMDLEDDASAVTSIVDFEDSYLQLTKRQLPNKTEFYAITKPFSERGLIHIDSDEDDPAIVFIRIYPVIVELLHGSALEKLGGYIDAENEGIDINDDFDDTDNEAELEGEGA